jgi:hypothetical protein
MNYVALHDSLAPNGRLLCDIYVYIYIYISCYIYIYIYIHIYIYIYRIRSDYEANGANDCSKS